MSGHSQTSRAEKGYTMKNYFEKFNYTSNNYLIIRTIETYHRTASGKSWKSKPDEIEKDVVTAKNYSYYVQAIPFFNNFGNGAYCRAKFSYEVSGYLPTTITTVSPYQETKKVATFKFIDIDKLTAKAGYRERFIVENAKYFDLWYQDGKRLLKLITSETDDKHAAIIDLKSLNWIN